MASLPHGIYEALLDEELSAILRGHPELRSVLGKLDPEEAPARYADFLARLLEKRPIQMVWQLDHPMPVEIFDENRRGG